MSKIIRNTPEEEEAIAGGIAADPDTYVPCDEPNARMAGHELVSVRYDVEILEAFRATGDGWQTRMNDALRDWLRTHRP